MFLWHVAAARDPIMPIMPIGLFRNPDFATAIAIALSSARLAGNLQVNHAERGAALRLPPLPGLAAAFLQLGMLVQLDGEVNRQALMIAYVDDYRLMMRAALLSAPLARAMRRQRPGLARRSRGGVTARPLCAAARVPVGGQAG